MISVLNITEPMTRPAFHVRCWAAIFSQGRRASQAALMALVRLADYVAFSSGMTTLKNVCARLFNSR
jgi:hypothetical protein